MPLGQLQPCRPLCPSLYRSWPESGNRAGSQTLLGSQPPRVNLETHSLTVTGSGLNLGAVSVPSRAYVRCHEAELAELCRYLLTGLHRGDPFPLEVCMVCGLVVGAPIPCDRGMSSCRGRSRESGQDILRLDPFSCEDPAAETPCAPKGGASYTPHASSTSSLLSCLVAGGKRSKAPNNQGRPPEQAALRVTLGVGMQQRSKSSQAAQQGDIWL